MTSLAGAMTMFLAAIPKIIGFLVIIILGWIIAGLVAKAVAALLRTVRFNDLAERSGFARFVDSMGVKTDAAWLPRADHEVVCPPYRVGCGVRRPWSTGSFRCLATVSALASESGGRPRCLGYRRARRGRIGEPRARGGESSWVG